MQVEQWREIAAIVSGLSGDTKQVFMAYFGLQAAKWVLTSITVLIPLMYALRMTTRITNGVITSHKLMREAGIRPPFFDEEIESVKEMIRRGRSAK